MKMRFSTLLRDYGPIKRATQCSDVEWRAACAARRFLTVYHGEDDWCTPVIGLVAHHGCVNTLCKLVTTRPVPPQVEEIIGLRDNQDAWDLCQPS